MTKSLGAIVTTVVVMASGCSSTQAPTSPNQATAPQHSYAADSSTASRTAGGPQPTSPPPAPPPSPSPGMGSPGSKKEEQPAADKMLTEANSLAALAMAEQFISQSANACEHACLALASMERAAQQICVASGSQSPTCEDARARVRRARARVREACTVCPLGPTTDPDAPI